MQKLDIEKGDYVEVEEGYILSKPRKLIDPSLRIKRIQGSKGRWEGSVTMNYRFTFGFLENTVFIRTIGTHDNLKK